MQKQITNDVEGPSAKYQQFFAACVVNLLMMGYGITCGWSSPAIVLLTSDESPLPSGKISMVEGSWIASLTNLGGLVGNIFFGYVTTKFGRKIPLITISIPIIISWTLILNAQNFYYLYAARVLNGFGGAGVFVIVPLFLSEIASDCVRGVIGSTFVLSFNMGVLMVFAMGNYCDYYSIPKLVICLTLIFAILFPLFPESPIFLIRKSQQSQTEIEKQSRILAAENSIRFYKNLSRKNGRHIELIKCEVNRLQNAICGANIDKQTHENSLKWSDFTTGPARKAMLISIVLIVINQLSGCVAMLNYTATIFQGAKSNLSPNFSAMIVGVIELLGSICSLILVDRFGRKLLFAISTSFTAVGLITFSVFMWLKSQQYDVEAFNWIPVASFSFIIFIASFAILNLPFLVISELMPDKVKDLNVSLCIGLLWTLSFIVVKYLPLMIEAIGFHTSLLFFAGICVFGTVFIVFFVPETKGKSYEQIMESLQ